MAKTESRVLILLALVANGLIAVLKFIGAFISGSSAMLAEGFHSLADTGNQLFLLRGAAVSKYAANARHPFGRGKELYFWAFLVAVFLFVGGSVVALIEGWERFHHPEEATNFLFNIGVLGLAAIFEIFIAFRPALKEFNRRRGGRRRWAYIRQSTDPALLVVLFEDAAAVLGLFLASGGLILAEATGDPRWDGVASMSVGVLLAVTAWLLAVETKSMLVGEGASRAERSAIRAATLTVPEVRSIGRLLTMQLGPGQVLVNMDVEFDEGLSRAQVMSAVDAIETQIARAVPTATRIFIEPEAP